MLMSLDVRPSAAYTSSHLITSHHIPPCDTYDATQLLQQLEDACTELPQTIVVYDDKVRELASGRRERDRRVSVRA